MPLWRPGKLASPQANTSLHMKSTSSAPDASTDRLVGSRRANGKLLIPLRVSSLYILSVFVLFLVILFQLGSRDRSVSPLPNLRASLFGESVRRQEAYYDQLEPGLQCRPRSLFSLQFSEAPSNMALMQEAKRIAAEFEYSTADVNKCVKFFIEQMEEGLAKQGTMMSQIPTYVTAVPNGTEKGTYLAVDLGGTNFRVCSVDLHGNHTFSLKQSKVAVPRSMMEANTASELFSFLAKQIEIFLRTHHSEHFQGHVRRSSSVQTLDLGFTFSFPTDQMGINKGKLIRWTKGYDIAEVIGQDLCALLQKEIDALHLPVRVVALVNDTVGTLMARSYTSPGTTRTLIGAIFGTGTNGAYVEKLSKVKKMAEMDAQDGGATYDTSTGIMIINTEWGSFDNNLTVMPNTPYDEALDKESNNPGIQMFEKRVSGMFLGEILRRAILSLYQQTDPKVALFQDVSSEGNDASSTSVDDNSALYMQWGIDTSFLSMVEEDSSEHFRLTRQTLERDLGVSGASMEDCTVIKMLVHAIGKRAARLAAVALGAVVISTDKLHEDDVIDIGIDGSLAEYYPGFEDYLRETFREIPEIGEEGEKKIRIGLAKDGSGLGAALIALEAAKTEEKE